MDADFYELQPGLYGLYLYVLDGHEPVPAKSLGEHAIFMSDPRNACGCRPFSWASTWGGSGGGRVSTKLWCSGVAMTSARIATRAGTRRKRGTGSGASG
jgi:hypothetical protein